MIAYASVVGDCAVRVFWRVFDCLARVRNLQQRVFLVLLQTPSDRSLAASKQSVSPCTCGYPDGVPGPGLFLDSLFS